jgi:hypothetical protein
MTGGPSSAGTWGSMPVDVSGNVGYGPWWRCALSRTSLSRTSRTKAAVGAFLLGLVALGVYHAPSARAACVPGDSATSAHTPSGTGVFHGWDRVLIQPQCIDYDFDAWTNHGHGDKYVALVHSTGTFHTHCDSLATGSQNASCSRTLSSKQHMSFHSTDGTDGLYGDGHGISDHFMEALP